MSQEMELADVFLRHTHPEEDGWVLFPKIELRKRTVEHAYKRNDVLQLICVNMNEPFVSRNQIQAAQDLQEECNQKYPELTVKVQLVYGKLLMNPHKLPKGISVLSIMEDDDIAHSDNTFQ